jgi:lipid A 3-O-deacylase
MLNRAAPILAAFALAPAAAAQTAITLMHDNDEWAHTEREYASGSRLAVVSRDWGKADVAQTFARWLPGIEPGEGVSTGFGAGHYFYAPEDLNAIAPIPNQRPYAGWLHGSALLIGEASNHQDTWKLDVGVIGPSSQSEEMEEFFHNIFSGRDMLGWDNQITDRAGANATWERRWRNLTPVSNGLSLDISPAVGLEAGNVSTAANAGLTVRIGSNLDADFGAPRAGALGGSLARHHRPGWSAYAFISANARYQAYDIFLDEPGGDDGDAVRAGSAITRDKTRAEASLGAVLAYGGARLTFAMTEESKRYDQQSERQRFGEVTLGWSF